MEQKKYNFSLTLAEANVVVNSLKEQPMRLVEHIVVSLDNQYTMQLNAEKAAEAAKEKTGDETKAKEAVETNDNTSTPATAPAV